MTVKIMPDGTEFVAVDRPWRRRRYFKGLWTVYRKIDGIRAIRDGKYIRSSKGKPLHNLNHLEIEDAEIFSKDFSTTKALIGTRKRKGSEKYITQDMVYELKTSNSDPRLYLGHILCPSVPELNALRDEQVLLGYEGIIIRQGKTWYKFEPEKIIQATITGLQESAGKEPGILGSLHISHKGEPQSSINIGFTDEQRRDFWNRRDSLIGTIIEVGYHELTTKNKMKSPFFKRELFDQKEEKFE